MVNTTTETPMTARAIKSVSQRAAVMTTGNTQYKRG